MKPIIFCIVGLSLLVLACETQPEDLRLYDQLVVETNYDEAVDFNAYETYSISVDTIGLVSNVAGDDTIIVGINYARPVIAAVSGHLEIAGYNKVAKTESPDLAINIFVVRDLNIFQQVNYPNYYGYSGYYYPYYYGYGSYYDYPYVSTYVYNNAVLVVEIVDLKNVSNNQVRVIWNAYMGDVLTAPDARALSEKAITQAFQQSPYLRRRQ